jgi:uncharacterized membrane protein
MYEEEARKIVEETFEQAFDETRFSFFIRNLLDIDKSKAFNWRTGYNIPKAFHDHIKKYKRIGKYLDPEKKELDVLIVQLRKDTALDQARTMQRNFVAWYLTQDHEKDAAIVAFYASETPDWRFSFVRMKYHWDRSPQGKLKPVKDITEARRYSFLVGKGEPSHTAQRLLIPLLKDDEEKPAINVIEQIFSIDKVTDEFFDEYKQLFEKLKIELERIVDKDPKVKQDFIINEVSTSGFAKKLMGQLVFLYFLQKKGWLGVGINADWGTGPRNFLRQIFDKKQDRNFFNDILEPLFYEVLAVDRRANKDICAWGCRIPFLNGGLFEPIKNYNWGKTDILLPNPVFGAIFDVFDRFNFTVKEDEPLEKEVAVDPEMLGKVFEKLLDSADQKSKGAFYTPRVIVNYMCQESLINYLYTRMNKKIFREEISKLVRWGDLAKENEKAVKMGVLKQGYKLPASIPQNAQELDVLLKNIKVCDPAIGSGAFPVGMMHEIVRVRDTLTSYLGDEINRTHYLLKNHAIKESLYGVDIDSSAVDIAKLRLWLSLLVDEENVKEISPLPNLDYKIMQGDSLLESYKGIKLYNGELSKHTKEHFEDEITALSARVKELTKTCIETSQTDKLSKVIKDKKKQFENEIKSCQKRIEELKKARESGKSTAVMQPSFSFGETESQRKKDELRRLRKALFNESDRQKKEVYKIAIEKLVWDLIKATLKEEDQEELINEVDNFRLSNQRPFMLWRLHFDEIFDRENGGFDVVIGNPPYVSNKMVDKDYQEYYKQVYGISDDLYNYFFIKALDIARDSAAVAYISSDTYLTLQTKINLRRLFQGNRILEIIKTENVFENAMVSPAIIILCKEDCSDFNYDLVFKDAINSFDDPEPFIIDIDVFRDAVNRVFFMPTSLNMQIYKKFNSNTRQLLEKWWDKISTSKKITENEVELESYRQSLQPGDVTLLGLITEGGVGLQTGDNGRFVGVLEGSSVAARIIQTRPAKLLEAVKKHKIGSLKKLTTLTEAREFLINIDEMEIRELFDKLKGKYGRDIFGQGYIYKIIAPGELAVIEKLCDEEKLKGINMNKPHFVPYDKGDRDGNRWYLETPYYIDWSKGSVMWLRANTGKKGQGMPVVRNPQFYFKEGFCWSDIHTVLVKARLKEHGVYDVKSMSMFSQLFTTPDWYLVCIMNSTFISEFSFDFINNTQTLQMNDARQLPIIIPSPQQLNEFKDLFNHAYKVKRKQFSGQLSDETANQKLAEIQDDLDLMVYRLYDIIV